MYFLKQLIGALTAPLTVGLLTGAIAIVYWARGRSLVAQRLLIVTAVIVYLGAIPLVGDALLSPLESFYAPLSQNKPIPSVKYIVVLGSGYTPQGGVPITASLDEDGLIRIVEGVRILRKLPGAQLIASGGAPANKAPPARGYVVLAHDLGIPDSSLVTLDRSLDTHDETEVVATFVGKTPFLLVTSAYHMPRAMRLMRRAGAHPIPAPTGQRVLGSVWRADWRKLLPSASALRNTERSLHEYIGIAAFITGID